MSTKQMADHLSKQAQELANQVANLQAQVLRKENTLLKKQMAMSGTASAQSPNPNNLQDAMTRLPFFLAPGNVGDINKVIWPFWFSTSAIQVAPNQQISSNFSVTQEAAFVAMAITKTVFLKTTVPALNYQYLDPEQPGVGGTATGLRWSFRDLSSSREFMGQSIDIDTIGSPRFPTRLGSPMLILPRSNIEVSFDNSNPTATYVPVMTFFGYRVRIEDAADIMSTVSGG